MVVHGSGGNGCTAMPVSYLGNGLCTSQVLGRCQNSIADATSRGPTRRPTLLGLFEGDTQVSSKTDNCVSQGHFHLPLLPRISEKLHQSKSHSRTFREILNTTLEISCLDFCAFLENSKFNRDTMKQLLGKSEQIFDHN